MAILKGRLSRALAVAFGLFLFAQPAAPADSAKPKDHKITLCHKGKTISVGPVAAVMHILIHGDHPGSCEVPPDPGGGSGI